MSEFEPLLLKVFPLPSAVLFPSSILPLHIFEPRYRALVRAALATDSMMALAHLKPGWESDYGGRPPLKPLCTVGRIVWHESLADGRFNILVEGVSRADILSERPPVHLYREVEARLAPDPPYQGPEEAALRAAILELAMRMPPEVRAEWLEMPSRAQGGALADAVAAAVVPGLERRWALLSERDVRSRLQSVLTELGEALARLPPLPFERPLN